MDNCQLSPQALTRSRDASYSGDRSNENVPSCVPALSVSGCLIAGIYTIDWWLPSGLAVPVLYVIPVLMSSWARHRLAVPLVAAIVSFLTVAGIGGSPADSFHWVTVCNRAMAMLIIWTTAILCLRRQWSEEELRRVYEGIEQQVSERTTALKQANEELKLLRTEALAHLGTLVQSSDDALVGLTMDGRVVSWNDGAERIYGYQSDEIMGRFVGRLVPRDRRRELPNILRKIRRGDRLRNFETVQVKKNGRKIDVSLTVTTVKDAAGRAVGVLAIARDITKRRRMEVDLRESEARFHMMADTAPVMVWISELEAGWTFFNKRWLEFTGRSMDEERGNGWLQAVHPNDRPRCIQTYQSALHDRQPFTMEYRLQRADGTYRWMLDTGVPRIEPGNRLSGYIGSCIDLTERREMEDELRKTLKEKESLLREVHHRVKNNLQVISSLLNLQAASIKDPQVVQLFRESQVRITSIALLHETLHRSNNLSCIQMNEYVRTLTGHLFRSYGVDPQAISLTLDVGDVELDIDTAMTCGLIIEELVSNCLKHAFVRGRGGRIHIDLHLKDDEHYVLRVSDDGVGIPKDGMLNNPDSLGLELVSLMAEKLEGTSELQSGQGTEWRIQFRPLHYKERM